MAIKRSIEIDVETRQAIKAMNELGGTFEDVFNEAEPLTTQLGEMEDVLYAMAAAGDTTSKEFQDLSKQVGDMKKVIIETDLEIDGLSQTMSQNVGGALNGVASGFALAQGAMGAFGASGEAVEEALLKVQSAMAISQGLQGIRESVASFKALRKSIMATTVVQKALNFVMNLNPIGLIIAGVVALGAAIALLWSPIKKLGQFFGLVAEEAESAEDANKKLTASMEAQEKALERLEKRQEKMHDNRMRELELRDASEDEKHKATLERLAVEEARRKVQLATSKGNIALLTKQYKNAKKEEDYETARSIKEQLTAEKAKVVEMQNNYDEYNLSRQEQEKKFNKWKADEDKKATDKEKAKLKERNDNYKAFLVERRNAEKKIEDLRANAIKDEEERKLELARLAFERELETLEGTEEQKGEQKKLITERYEKEIRELKLSYVNEDIELRGLDVENHRTTEEKKYNNYLHYAQLKTEKDNELKRQEIEDEQAVVDAKSAMAIQGFQLVSDLANVFAGKSEAQQKRAFNISKAASIAQAVISTYQGATAIFASAAANPKSVLFPAQPFIAAGLAIAGGLKNVAEISKTKFGGGAGSGGSNYSAPSAGGVGGGSNVANFNVVGNTGVNQLAETLGENDKAPIKAFVVGSDVTTQQSLDRNKVNTATL